MTVPPERLSFLRAFRDAARQLAIHPYGCRVLQRCLEYLPNDYCRGMIDELHGIADSLMQDQFGVSTTFFLCLVLTDRLIRIMLCSTFYNMVSPTTA